MSPSRHCGVSRAQVSASQVSASQVSASQVSASQVSTLSTARRSTPSARSRDGLPAGQKRRSGAPAATGRYLWQLPSKVWQYSPAWQKCQMRELAAWHSHVLTVTSPSPQWANRLNLTAANASDASRQLNSEARTINRVFTSTPQFFPAPMRCDGMRETTQRRGRLPVSVCGRLWRSRTNPTHGGPHGTSGARSHKRLKDCPQRHLTSAC
jgi:hypothetical protein